MLKMNKQDFDATMDMAKGLGIKTLGELKEFKEVAKCKSNDELIYAMQKSLGVTE